MDTLMIVLRLFHIFAGVYWVGAIALTVWILAPIVKATGNSGAQVMRGFLLNKFYTRSFPLVSVLTVLSGAIMFYKTSGEFNEYWLRSANGIVLSIGSVAGILAMMYGGATLGIGMDRYTAWSARLGPTTTEEEQREGAAFTRYLIRHGNISLGLMLVALFCMAIFRYV